MSTVICLLTCLFHHRWPPHRWLCFFLLVCSSSPVVPAVRVKPELRVHVASEGLMTIEASGTGPVDQLREG